VQDLERGHVFNGRYAIERVLGRGGMGVVYEALDENTQRRRALKVMLPSVVSNDELRRRFKQEATVGARIESEHVAEVLDAGVDADTGSPFMVLELLKGDELGELCERKGALPGEVVALLLGQAARALDKAHAAGVVHRDLKPANLFVTYRDDGSPRVKLLDFGIAKIVSESIRGAETKGILGSPLFISPEQVHGEAAISPRTDVYAVGHIAYNLLVGEPYWQSEMDQHQAVYPLLMKVVSGPPLAASERALGRRGIALPTGFDAWFARATAVDPDERFARVGEAIEALRLLLGAEALSKPSPPVLAPVEPPRSIDTDVAGAVAATIPGAPMPAPRAPSRAGLYVGAGLAVAVVAVGVGGWAGGLFGAAVPVVESAAPIPAPAPPPRPTASIVAPAKPPLELEGIWHSKTGNRYRAHWNGKAYEFRVVDAQAFAGQGYAADEPRFLLEPKGEAFAVVDLVRPAARPGQRYDVARAKESCLKSWDRVGDELLTARLEGGVLKVKMTRTLPADGELVVEGTTVVGCRGLAPASQSAIENTFTRP
jgi:hypothetical protein